MPGRRAAAVVALLAIGACSRPPAPPTVEPGPVETIRGSERLGWSQTAADAAELATLRYAVYVDGQRFELTGASCTRSQAETSFTCSAPLPRLTSGSHTLELATFIIDGSTLESGRSSALQVNVTGAATAGPSDRLPGGAESPIVTHDGIRLDVARMFTGVRDPVDVAFLPDGRLLIAEREGRLRMVRDGRLRAAPAWLQPARHSDQEHLLAIAVDPDFDRSHLVHSIYTTMSARGELVFCLVRLREAGDTFGEPAVLFDNVPASPLRAAAALRFGPDGTLYAALDEGGRPNAAGDLASPNGKVLRLNPDGTTPDDQAAGTPTYATGIQSPRGLGWRLPSGPLWIASQQGDAHRLYAVEASGPPRRGVVRVAFMLPPETVPSAVAVYPISGFPMLRGDVLIGSGEGRHLLRLRTDRIAPARIVATEHLLQDQIGSVRTVTVGPDGAIYLGTADALWRLTPH